MERMVRKRAGFLFFFICGLISGVLAGVSVLTVIVSYRIESCLKQTASMAAIIEEKTIELQQLEKSINTGDYVLKAIDLVFISEDEIDTIAMEQEIRKKLSHLLGKNIKSMDVDTISQVIDRRIFRLDGKEYQLTLKKLILAETLSIWIEAEELG